MSAVGTIKESRIDRLMIMFRASLLQLLNQYWYLKIEGQSQSFIGCYLSIIHQKTCDKDCILGPDILQLNNNLV